MSPELLESCPVCGSSELKNYLQVEDFTVSHEKFTIMQCRSCSFLFTNPRPGEDEIGVYYESQDYISHHDEEKTWMSKVYNSVRNYTIGEKIKLVDNASQTKGKLLDIGCGTGVFLKACKQDGWNISGTEPDPGARSVASQRIGEQLHESIFAPELATETFDIITMWHVLEHVHRLNETMAWIRQRLSENGHVLIAVPNPESHDAKSYGAYWAAYDVPRHLYHFTKSTMHGLVERHNLTIDRILPMWFDSFYVSMLSTKYKNKQISLPQSVVSGLVSNLKGRPKNALDVNTSSLIYVISKK